MIFKCKLFVLKKHFEKLQMSNLQKVLACPGHCFYTFVPPFPVYIHGSCSEVFAAKGSIARKEMGR